MSDMIELEKEAFKVKMHDGTVVEMVLPSVPRMREMIAEISACEPQKVNELMDSYFIECGYPKANLNLLQPKAYNKIWEALLGKKN